MVSGRPMLSRPPAWWRGPASFDGTRISMPVEGCEIYELPATSPQMLLALAFVESADHAVSFARKFGLLFSPRPEEATGTAEESFADWMREVGKLRGALGLYVLLRDVSAGRNGEAARKLRAFVERVVEDPPSTSREVAQRASEALAEFAAEGLGGTALSTAAAAGFADDGHPLDFSWSARVPTLLGLAWYSFAHLIITRVAMIECALCGRIFLPDDPRRQYCSTSCSSRARYERWKAKKGAHR